MNRFIQVILTIALSIILIVAITTMIRIHNATNLTIHGAVNAAHYVFEDEHTVDLTNVITNTGILHIVTVSDEPGIETSTTYSTFNEAYAAFETYIANY